MHTAERAAAAVRAAQRGRRRPLEHGHRIVAPRERPGRPAVSVSLAQGDVVAPGREPHRRALDALRDAAAPAHLLNGGVATAASPRDGVE